ncbi:hypothetical protein LTAR_00404 [Leptolinea tardivitalis]|nr:hypothetical protein LTAR_00404 [Leptolinea tardivitalis]
MKPVSVRLELSPTLEYLSPAIQACSLQVGSIHIVLEEKPVGEMSKTGADVSLRWGDIGLKENQFVYRIGSDRLVFAVHKENPVTLLEKSQMIVLLRGGLGTWADALDQYCPNCTASETFRKTAVEPWQYSAGTDIHGELSRLVPEIDSAGLNPVWLAPAPKNLVESITNNPGAIGWLPARWLSNNLKEVAIEGIDPGAQTIPVIAITPLQPQPEIQQFLECLQSSYGN